MRWPIEIIALLLLGGCAAVAPAPAPIYICYQSVDGDGDKLTICEPHDPKGYVPVYQTTPHTNL